jgi:hypothetical protein
MLGANPRKVRDLGVCEDSLARFDGDHNSSPRKLWTHLNFENADTVQKASSAGRFFSPFSMARTASTSKTPIQVGPPQAKGNHPCRNHVCSPSRVKPSRRENTHVPHLASLRIVGPPVTHWQSLCRGPSSKPLQHVLKNTGPDLPRLRLNRFGPCGPWLSSYSAIVSSRCFAASMLPARSYLSDSEG